VFATSCSEEQHIDGLWATKARSRRRHREKQLAVGTQ
jgi:hypothetical protein